MPTFTGSAEPGATVRIYSDGVELLGVAEVWPAQERRRRSEGETGAGRKVRSRTGSVGRRNGASRVGGAGGGADEFALGYLRSVPDLASAIRGPSASEMMLDLGGDGSRFESPFAGSLL